MAVLVFANGVIEEIDWIRPYLDEATAIVAADGGTRHLMALGRAPDVVIGDMDSLPDEAAAWLQAEGTTFIPYPPAKDETDLELALQHVAHNYDGDIYLFGALGGRLDQTLSNILLLAHPALQDKPIQLISQMERAWLVTSKTEICGASGDMVSLIPLGSDVHIRATTGLRWALNDEPLIFGHARGISNVMTADKATVSVGEGSLLCIHAAGLR